MQVAAIQTTPVADPAGNAAEHARLIGEAAAKGARVCAFPELSLTGYELHPVRPLTEDDEHWAPIRSACAAHDAYALVGAPLSTPDGVVIATVVIGPTGETLGHYAKRHLDDVEARLFVPGDHHLLLEVDDWTLGLAVCSDAAVPSHAVEVRAGGADVYVVSALYPKVSARYPRGPEARIAEQLGHAAGLGMWAVLAQYTGRAGDYDTAGGSGVWRPGGAVDVRLGDEPGVAVATLTRP
ncbi:carbon-nitrogen hydrolase family protein [Saccharothrix australiensis]|uniref:Putative amidohydrolase n=1 Tax=Saccharothrix australiensis TaxID=2072 RepID=A0A495VX74_9PSEU|nr:carbon-nitrogen hydrolase family protein [Saccharothrix australiensis]RKT52975.1 putative amidohydrolase [Saccharothrix australiensis]